MRRFICCTLLLAASAAPSRQIDDQRAMAVAFDAHWCLYVRHLFGCPDAGDVTAETCRVPAGTTDYREFSKARELAKKLFDLRD